MILTHILGEGSADEFIFSAVVLTGLVLLLRRTERRARRRRQDMEEKASAREQ